MSDSTVGEFSILRRSSAVVPFRQSRVSCCSEANRRRTTVAAIKGRAIVGLQASTRLRRPIRRLNLGRKLREFDVFVEEFVEVVIKGAVVVSIQIKECMIEGVAIREDPFLKETRIWLIGVRTFEEASENIVIQRVTANVVIVVIQGRCSSD